jgi:hypothetical protein
MDLETMKRVATRVAGENCFADEVACAGYVLTLVKEVERLGRLVEAREQACSEAMLANGELNAEVMRRALENERLTAERDAALLKAQIIEDGAAEMKGDLSDARAKIGALLHEIALTSIAINMMRADAPPLDGPNAIQFLMQMRGALAVMD